MESIRDKLLEVQWRWFGHVSRMIENRITMSGYEANGKGKSRRDRSRRSWV